MTSDRLPPVRLGEIATLVAASLKTDHRIAITERPDFPDHWRIECTCGHQGEWRLAVGRGITEVLKDGTTHIEGGTNA